MRYTYIRKWWKKSWINVCGPMVQYWNLIRPPLYLSLPSSHFISFHFSRLILRGPSSVFPTRVRVAAIFPIYSWVGRIFRHFNSLFQHDRKASITNLWHLFRPFSLGFSGKNFGSFPGTLFVFISIFIFTFLVHYSSFTRKEFLLFASCIWIFLVWEGVPGRNWTRLPDSTRRTNHRATPHPH